MNGEYLRAYYSNKRLGIKKILPKYSTRQKWKIFFFGKCCWTCKHFDKNTLFCKDGAGDISCMFTLPLKPNKDYRKTVGSGCESWK